MSHASLFRTPSLDLFVRLNATFSEDNMGAYQRICSSLMLACTNNLPVSIRKDIGRVAVGRPLKTRCRFAAVFRSPALKMYSVLVEDLSNSPEAAPSDFQTDSPLVQFNPNVSKAQVILDPPIKMFGVGILGSQVRSVFVGGHTIPDVRSRWPSCWAGGRRWPRSR